MNKEKCACYVLLKLPALSGMAASSLRIHRYSAVKAVIAVDAKCVNHQAHE